MCLVVCRVMFIDVVRCSFVVVACVLFMCCRLLSLVCNVVACCCLLLCVGVCCCVLVVCVLSFVGNGWLFVVVC